MGSAGFPRQADEQSVARRARLLLQAGRGFGARPDERPMRQAQGLRLGGHENRLFGGAGAQPVIDGGDEDAAGVGPRVPARKKMHHRNRIGPAGDGRDDAVRMVQPGKATIQHRAARTPNRPWGGRGERDLTVQAQRARFCSRSEP